MTTVQPIPSDIGQPITDNSQQPTDNGQRTTDNGQPTYDFLNASMSYSSIKMINRSINHWIYAKTHPKQTPAMFFGSAFHCYLLERIKFNERYVVNPFDDKRSKGFKEWAMQNEGKIILTQDQMQTLRDMRSAVAVHPVLPDILNFEPYSTELHDGTVLTDYVLQGDYKVEYAFNFFYRGVKCKGFYDYVSFSRDIIVDIKTSSDCSDEDIIAKDMIKYEYYIQEFFYKLGYTLNVKKGVVPQFIFVFIETEPPYGISIRTLGRDWEEPAIAKINQAIDKYNRFKMQPENFWGYAPNQINVEVPKWFLQKFY